MAVISGMQYRESFSDRPVIPRPHRGTDKSGINTSKNISAEPGNAPYRIEKNNDVSQK